MWIEELKNGKYKYVERYRDPYTKKYKKVSVVLEKNTAQTRNKAVLILQDKIDEKNKTSQISEITFRELNDEFLKHWRPTVKDSTILSKATLDKIIANFIDDDIIISTINKRKAIQILTDIQDNKSVATTKLCKARLVQIFNYACDIELLHSNPFLDIKIKKQDDEIKENKIKVVTASELIEIVNNLKSLGFKLYADMTEFLFLTGLRFGELSALTKNDIDLNNSTLTVNKNYDGRNKKITSPKTKASNRIIILSDRAIEIIKRNISDYTDYIFHNKKMKLVEYDAYYQALKKYTNITPHVLRHSHISFLAEQGVPVRVIMSQVGHTSPDITLKIYSHVTPDMHKQMNDALNNFAP